MPRRMILFAVLIMVCLAVQGIASGEAKAPDNSKLMLKEGWSVQSSGKIKEGGEALSKPGASTARWYSSNVPSTVMAVLTAHNVYPDPYFGKNLLAWPGTWPKQLDTSSFPMPPFSPFRKAWWYRTEFEMPAEFEGKRIQLHFDGINYRANIWLNGSLVAGSDEAVGTFRIFEFDITGIARPGEKNALAVEVIPPGHRDLQFCWVDWNPAPPDRDMGIWRDVYITSSGPVALRHPHVLTDLEVPSLDAAHLTVMVEAKNATNKKVNGVLKGWIGSKKFSKNVELGASESRTISFAPDEFPQLNLSKPRLWWPYHLGPQNLYELALEFETGGGVSDRAKTRFGIREITSEIIEGDWLLFQFNGKRLLIRGAAWCPDMMFRFDLDRVRAELRYVQEMNLNTLRLEGKLESNDLFYELCDELGILVMPGWCCCHQWERWKKWDDEDYIVSKLCQRDQILRLRSHASMLAWLYGSDNPPPPDVERTYLDIFEECSWPNPVVSSAAAKPTELTGPSGIKMRGPYEYVPPVYWYTDTQRGGAFGFCAEIGPGPGPPPVESLKMFIPQDHLWPIDDYWNYHAGRLLFSDLDVFNNASRNRYGEAKDVYDYDMKAQAMTYDGQRAMMEAWGRNKFKATGVIQWLMNNAWPSMIWHLYDYYLRPAGGYYGTRKALEPLHVQYSYDDASVVVVNSYFREFHDMKVSARVYNLDMTEKFSKQEVINVPENSSIRVFTIPSLSGLTTTYFVKLDLADAEGEIVSENFYWLSTKKDVLDWKRSSFSHTPTKQDADLTGLNDLPEVKLKVHVNHGSKGVMGHALVTIENPTPHLAFMVHLKLTKGDGGQEILPVFWQDNYFPLIPGEKRTIKAEYRLKDLGDAKPCLEVEAWNAQKNIY